ncbi:MAG: LemA family protein [Candidatus Ancillula sp.]|nr:LemA family protein [Candidatus Ancillula sp.]
METRAVREKEANMEVLIVVVVVVVVVVVAVLFAFAQINGLRKASIGVENDFSGITVQLERRTNLIPNLVNTVKGYAKHEAETLEKVVAQRAASTQMQVTPENAAKLAQMEGTISGALSRLMAVSEGYPDLKANQNFLQLMAELTDTEDKITGARNLYNRSVQNLNVKMETYPSAWFVGLANVKKAEFFNVSEERQEQIQQTPNVEF